MYNVFLFWLLLFFSIFVFAVMLLIDNFFRSFRYVYHPIENDDISFILFFCFSALFMYRRTQYFPLTLSPTSPPPPSSILWKDVKTWIEKKITKLLLSITSNHIDSSIFFLDFRNKISKELCGFCALRSGHASKL